VTNRENLDAVPELFEALAQRSCVRAKFRRDQLQPLPILARDRKMIKDP
jgi:hypothetical protein